jgi:hypothetical protein
LNNAFSDLLLGFSANHQMTPAGDLLPLAGESLFPALWSRTNVELVAHLDAIFHLLFHGIVPSMFEMLGEALKYVGVRSSFVPFANRVLVSLKELHLDNFPVYPIGKDWSTGPWQGSQKVAFSRVMPYLVSHIIHLTNTKFHKVSDQPKKFLASECAHLLEWVTAALSGVLSRIMQRRSTAALVAQLHEYIKIFLSASADLEKFYKKKRSVVLQEEIGPKDKPSRTTKKKKGQAGEASVWDDVPQTFPKRKRIEQKRTGKTLTPVWSRTGNFLSMLNLPS